MRENREYRTATMLSCVYSSYTTVLKLYPKCTLAVFLPLHKFPSTMRKAFSMWEILFPHQLNLMEMKDDETISHIGI